MSIETENHIPPDSIGPRWPPKESSFNRIKAIYNVGIVDSNESLSSVLELINENVEKLGESGKDRLSARLFITDNCLIRNLHRFEDIGEALIPLSGTSREFDKTNIVYLGVNLHSRLSNSSDLSRSITNVENAIARGTGNYKLIVERAKLQGYSLQTLSKEAKNDANVQEQMIQLYKRFGWSKEDVVEILSKDTNIIAVAQIGEKIASAGIAETLKLDFVSGPIFRMAEITEAATDEKHQGKGLYSAVAATLMYELNQRSNNHMIFGDKLDLAFGECNGNEPGVLNAVKSLGRTFTFEVSRNLNLPFKGFLQQHVPIAGAPRSTPYNDLFPAFISRDDIKKFVEI